VIDQYLEGDEIDENFEEYEADLRMMELVRGVIREKKCRRKTPGICLKVLETDDFVLTETSRKP